MDKNARAVVEAQIGRVRRRLALRVIIESELLCLAFGLLATTLWFLVRPFALAQHGDATRWYVATGLLAASAIAGLILAWLRRPDRLASSLALDDRFGLKERVTTFLTLSDDQLATPAGHALLRDVGEHVTNLRVAGGFPLRLHWKELAMPAGALLLALLACVLDPWLGNLRFGSQSIAESPKKVVDATEVQQKLDDLKKILAERNKEEQQKSEALKDLEKEFEKLLNKPIDAKNEEKVRERIDDLRKLEDKMNDRLDGLKKEAAKSDALRRMLEKLELEKDAKPQEGPAKDFEDAMMKGDLDKAKKELEKLVKDLNNNKLDEKQQKQLADQFKNMRDKLQKLMDDNDFRKKVMQDFKDGKIDKERLQKELENFKDLQNLADILGECKECLDKGDGKAGSKKLEELANRFGEMELTEQEIRDLLRDQDEIDDAMRALNGALEGDEGEGDGQGGGPPGGRRRIDPNDPKSKIRDERSRAQVDKKGMPRITGYAPGGNYQKIPATSVEGAFRQAAQEAPDAIERQRIPDDARNITRGYFYKLGNQK